MDNTTISLLKSRDLKAFDALVKEYERKIYAFAYRFTKNHDDALDITQEVFLKIHKNIESFNEDSSISTWIYRITNNVCIDFVRKSKPTVSITDENQEYIYQIADNESTEKTVLNNELREEIFTSLSEIDENSRQIVILRDILGFSYQKIADILEIEEGTVKSRISRSRKKLRDNILFLRNKSKKSTSKNIETR